MIIDVQAHLLISDLEKLYAQGEFAYVCDGDNRGLSVEPEE